MTSYFWVGGTGSFNTSSNSTNFALTSGGSPVAAVVFASGDDITFDANSGSSFTVTINATAPTIRNLTVTGTSGMTLAGTTAFTVQGDISLPSSGLTWSSTGTLTISGSANKTLNFNGVTINGSLTVNAASSTITLAGNLVGVVAKSINFSNATLFDFAGYNVTFGSLASTGGTTRALTLGSGTHTFLDPGASVLTFSGASGLTLSAASSTILFTSASAKTFASNGYTYGVVKNAGAGALTITGSPTIGELGNTVQPCTITLTAGITVTVTTLSLSGTAGNLVTLQSSSAGTPATISKATGTVSVSYLSIKDSTVSGGATFNASLSTDVSGNTGWNFLTSYTLTAAAGSFALTGQTVALLYNRAISAGAASYALTGQNATLTYTPNATYTLSAMVGTFTLTGQSVNLIKNGAGYGMDALGSTPLASSTDAMEITGVGEATSSSDANGLGGVTNTGSGSATSSSTAYGVSDAAPPDTVGAARVIAVEITAAIDAAGTLRTFYVADALFVTRPTDTPANTAFDGSLIDPGSIAVTLFGDGRTGGGTRLALGEIRLTNADGQYDDWLTYSFDGRPLVIRRGTPGAYPAAFTSVFVGTMETLTVKRSEVIIRLRDKQLIFDRPALPAHYGGTNVLPNGLDGTPGDIMGKAKPRLYGKVFNISPPCVNTSKLVYQISDGAISSVEAVYDRGEALTAGADYANSGLLLSSTPAAGSFDTCLAEGLFRIGSSSAGEITVDATQGVAPTDRTASTILLSLALAAGVEAGEISGPDFAQLADDSPAVVGVWISTETETFAAVMNAVAASVGGYYFFDPNGILRTGQLTAPGGDPVLSVEEYDTFEPFERRPARDGDLPAWSFTVRHSKVWTPQTSDLAGSVTQDRRAFLASAFRAQRAEDATVKAQFLQAAEETVDTLLTDAADAANEASRRLGLHQVRRDFFDVSVDADLLTGSGVKLTDVVELTNTRFGLTEGRLFRLLGTRLELARKRATLTLWG